MRDLVYNLLQKYWSFFDSKGQFVPVKDYTYQLWPAGDTDYEELHCLSSKVGHIRQIHGGKWMFKALLTPKPHQEHVRNIEDFIWKFCVNYIPLNQVTRPVAYPIPHCDSAVHLTFSDGRWMWLWDAHQGYHQIGVEHDSQDKSAFTGPDATKWTYNSMPFGPVNRPAMFIAFIHDATVHGRS